MDRGEKAWPSMSGLGARGPGFVKLHAETRDTRPETRFSDHHAVTMRFQRTSHVIAVIREPRAYPRKVAKYKVAKLQRELFTFPCNPETLEPCNLLGLRPGAAGSTPSIVGADTPVRSQ